MTKPHTGALELGTDHACLTGDCKCFNSDGCVVEIGYHVEDMVKDANEQLAAKDAEIERITHLAEFAQAKIETQQTEIERLKIAEGDARMMAGFIVSDRAPGEQHWQTPFISVGSLLHKMIQKYEKDQ